MKHTDTDPPQQQTVSPKAPAQKEVSIPHALELALEHHQKGELPEAEALYTEILRHDPKQIAAVHMLGLIAHQVGKNIAAVELISEALKMSPDLPEAHNNLGISFRDLGRLDEAIASYTTAISLKPDYASAHYNLATLLRELEAFALACHDEPPGAVVVTGAVKLGVVLLGLFRETIMAPAVCTQL